MAKKSNKRNEFPNIPGIQFRKSAHRAGVGRCLARPVDGDEEVDVLSLSSNIPSQVKWQRPSHRLIQMPGRQY